MNDRTASILRVLLTGRSITQGEAVALGFGPQPIARSIHELREVGHDIVTVRKRDILMFDMDEPGRAAANECAELFKPGTCKIASLPLKDPNECLQAGRGDEVVNAIWRAKVYRPDGIISGAELLDVVLTDDNTESQPYPWPMLNELTHGLRQGELVTLTAGSGIGKSAIVREIAYHLLKLGETVGMIMLEESTKRTALGLMGIELNRPIHISKEGVNEEMVRTAFAATLGTGRVFLYDHFGSTEIENLLSRVRYMARSLGCRWVSWITSRLSYLASGMVMRGA